MEDDSFYKYFLMEYCDIGHNYRLDDVLSDLTNKEHLSYKSFDSNIFFSTAKIQSMN